MSLILFLLTYLYDPAHWQHYPRLDDVRNFSADAFYQTYLVTSEAIFELDEKTGVPVRTYGQAEGLPDDINLAVFDPEMNKFWITTTSGNLYTFIPTAGITHKIYISSTFKASSMGLNSEYLFLRYGNAIKAIGKRTEREENVSPTDDVNWTPAGNASTIRDDYPFLAPWHMIDNQLKRYDYSQVFTHNNKAYVSVPGYGYLVFDAFSWREILSYRGPSASNIYSLFVADNSVYAMGTDGVDQFMSDENRIVFRSFNNWAASSGPDPSWSKGLLDKLYRVNYSSVKLIDGNLFLLEKREADVMNIATRTLSEIQTEAWIYDVDYHRDSLLVATDQGVALTVIGKTEPEPLKDERSRLYDTDVLGIIRGDNARYFWTGKSVVKQSRTGWEYYNSPGFIPVPQEAVAGGDSLVVLGGKGGVVIYNPETYFQLSLTTREGLLSDNVTALLVDGDYLWIATDAGVSRFDLSTVLD